MDTCASSGTTVLEDPLALVEERPPAMNVATPEKNLPGPRKPWRPSLGVRLQITVGRRILRLSPDRAKLLHDKRALRIDGRTLDPQVQHMLWIQSLTRRPALHTLAVEKARSEYRLVRELMEDPIGGLRVSDRTIEREGTVGAGVPVRVYDPSRGSQTTPAVVFFHGGGGVIGDLETHDLVCRRLAREAGCKVIAVDYRLGPEHPFPTGHDDAVAAFRGIVAQASSWGIDPRRVAVAGDSMGGNLCAAVCLACRDTPPCFALVIYPGTDFANRAPSRERLGKGLFLEDATIDWFHRHYLGGADPTDPRASVLLGDLSGLPPMHVVTAGFDPLRDEGQAFAEALDAAGSPVEHREYPTLVHGFLQMAGICDAAARAFEDLADVLARAFATV